MDEENDPATVKDVTYMDFCRAIAQDYKVQLYKRHKTKQLHFPIKRGRRKIHASFDAVIVDKSGSEHPYMISQCPPIRNNERLKDFDYIYVIRPKSLMEIIAEAGIEIKSVSCTISEGGGWYSEGRKYFYKDISCEI